MTENFKQSGADPEARLRGYRVEGESGEKDPVFQKKAEKQKDSEVLEGYKKEAQEFLDSHRRLLATFAKDVSLRFKLSNAFFIDLKNGEINLDIRWFAERDYSKEQILWALLHENVHFIDLANDPEQMMANFEYIKQGARQTGTIILQKWEAKYGQSDPEFVEGLKTPQPIDSENPNSETMNATEMAAYEIRHRFFNILDDIYVNKTVSRKAPFYESQEPGGLEVRRLYREKLFKGTNYLSNPRHMQIMDSLLREDMVPDEDTVLTQEVKAILDKKILFQGQEYSIKEIVNNFIKPRTGRDTKAGQRYFVIKHVLEPIFLELLNKDLEEWDPQKPKEEEGQGNKSEDGKGKNSPSQANPFSRPYRDDQQNNPDQFKPSQMRKWSDKKKDDDKKKADKIIRDKENDKKTPEQLAQEAQNVMDKEWADKNNIPHELIQRFKNIEREVAPYLQDLSELWQRIIFGSTKKTERGMVGYFPSGTEMSIPKVIDEWPKIEKGQLEEARVMKKMETKEILIKNPELIRVRLVGDMSGSMNEVKRHVLEQCIVLLLSSLREFNTYLNLTRSRTKSKLEVDTEVWVFGDNAQKVKQLRTGPGQGMEDDRIEAIKIFQHLQNTLGNTFDNKALEEIIKSLELDKEKIEQGRIMEIVFEITDGGSSAYDKAKTAVDSLIRINVIARAFQIGPVSDEDKSIFNKVWNEGREEKLGEVVGEKIENLVPAIAELLKKYLGQVRL
ncbi:MAG: vWA domain-containing protein [Candidatus Taylorbacteria bacterium]|nr:vWA domain-containing protein [Candidatus Taylorbacteria bacterium]